MPLSCTDRATRALRKTHGPVEIHFVPPESLKGVLRPYLDPEIVAELSWDEIRERAGQAAAEERIARWQEEA